MKYQGRSVFSVHLGLFLILLLVLYPGIAGALEPELVFGKNSTPVWDAQQFVQADRAGRIYFFRSDTFDVYPINKDGRFGEPVRLESSTAAQGVTYNAVMSPAGDRWLVQGHRSARLFVDGKEKPLPALPYKPWSVAFLRDEPVAAVIPLPLGGRSVDIHKIGTPPWILKLGTDRWTSLVDLKGFTVAEILEGDGLNRAIAEHGAFLAGGRQGRLWAARQYGYRVQQFTPGGRLLFELTVDDGAARKKEEAKGIEVKLSGAGGHPTEATRNPREETGTYNQFTAEPVVEALTEGSDGRIYLFVRTRDGGLALDRYDPARVVLERVPLRMNLKNRPSLAAARDGLYLAAWNAQNGRWRISWEALEKAPWKKVEKVKINGVDVE